MAGPWGTKIDFPVVLVAEIEFSKNVGKPQEKTTIFEILASPGSLLRSLGSLLGPWGGLGPLLGALGPLLGDLGSFLSHLEAVLGRSWGLLARSWAVLDGQESQQGSEPGGLADQGREVLPPPGWNSYSGPPPPRVYSQPSRAKGRRKEGQWNSRTGECRVEKVERSAW